MAGKRPGAKQPVKKKTGRPSDFNPRIADLICERLADGQSLREICRDEGMPGRTTVFRWLEAHEDFRNQYAYARELQAEHYADEILEISDDGSNDWMERKSADGSSVIVADHEHISRSKLRVDARKWLLSKMMPKKYGEKVSAELTGKDGGPIATETNVKTIDPALLKVARNAILGEF